MENALNIYLFFLLAVLGSVLGSTLDCTASRFALDKSLPTGRSRCDSCKTTLGVRDLIPIFSFLFHKGKCRFCGAKIPIDCLISEILGVLLFLSLGFRFGFSLELVMWLIAGSVLLLLGLIDQKTCLLPDKLLLVLVLNRILFVFILGQPLLQTFKTMLIGAFSVSLPLLIIVLVFEFILKKEAMGGGDIKLLFVMGLYLSWDKMLLVIIISCFVALVCVSLMKDKHKQIPFGPFLAVAWLLVVLFGEKIINFYISLVF